MVKKIFFGIVIFLLLSTGITLFWGYQYLNPGADYIIGHLEENPEHSSFILFVNDQATVIKNAETEFPLANTKSLMIAGTFATQAMMNIIDTSQNVSLEELDKYYFPETDGGTHRAWLDEINDKYNEPDSVVLIEVARGMMKYSSHANASYLTGLLGINQINNFIKNVKLKPHTSIFHSLVAVLMTNEVQNAENKTAYIAQMKDDDYIEKAQQLYDKLAADTAFRNNLVMPSLQEQQVWSDRLERSTTLAYAKFMNDIIHDRTMAVQSRAIMKDLLDWPMDFPANRKTYSQLGAIGGRTLYTSTETIYAEDNKGNKIAFAIFFKELGPISSMKVMKALPLFEKKLLSSEAFRNEVIQTLRKSEK